MISIFNFSAICSVVSLFFLCPILVLHLSEVCVIVLDVLLVVVSAKTGTELVNPIKTANVVPNNFFLFI